MKISATIFGFLLLVTLTTQAQEIIHLDRKWYADRIRTTSKDLRPFELDTGMHYEVTDEGAEFRDAGQYSITTADLIVNNDSLTTTINTDSYKHGDTLDILIFNEIDVSHDHNFQI